MSKIYPKAYFEGGIKDLDGAKISVASSAVLYGLSVYTVFAVHGAEDQKKLGFRLPDHFRRLVNSARIIGIDTFEHEWTEEKFTKAVRDLFDANDVKEDVFVRATVHVSELLPGTRSRGMKTELSIFIYKAESILSKKGARLKTSIWRRIPDSAIPSRAKVNGAYVNSVLAKQDAIDSGYDDCIFLDGNGHVCELSAANIFLVRDGILVTPGTESDILEGINRRTVIEIAKDQGIPVLERAVDLTELYIADEVFACGTSAYLAPVIEVDARRIKAGKIGPVTEGLQKTYFDILYGRNAKYKKFLTEL